MDNIYWYEAPDEPRGHWDTITCPECHGTGLDDTDDTCPVCGGEGEVEKFTEYDRNDYDDDDR